MICLQFFGGGEAGYRDVAFVLKILYTGLPDREASDGMSTLPYRIRGLSSSLR